MSTETAMRTSRLMVNTVSHVGICKTTGSEGIVRVTNAAVSKKLICHRIEE